MLYLRMVSYGGGFFDNFVVDFVLLFLSAFSARAKISKIGVVFSAIVGAGFALAFPHLNLSDYYLISVRLLVSIIMCLCAVKMMTAKQFMLYYLVFVTYTFIAAGFCSFIAGTFAGAPIWLIFTCLAIYGFIMIKIIVALYAKKKAAQFEHNVTICACGKIVKIKGFFDSGNSLTEPKSNLPIIIVSYTVFAKLYPSITLQEVLLGKLNEKRMLKNEERRLGEYINYNTVAGKSKMFIFKPDGVKIDEKNIEVMVGLSIKGFGQYDCLLNRGCL